MSTKNPISTKIIGKLIIILILAKKILIVYIIFVECIIFTK